MQTVKKKSHFLNNEWKPIYCEKKHLQIEIGGDMPYYCEHCQESFSEQCDLKTHLRGHTGGKPFLCEHFPKAFSQKCDLKEHPCINTGEKAYISEFGQEEISDSNRSIVAFTPGINLTFADIVKKLFHKMAV